MESKKKVRTDAEMAKVQCRNWLGTLNNPPEDSTTEEWLQALFTATDAVYVVGQLEKGEEGTPHYQFFMNFKIARRFNWVKKFLPKAHLEEVEVNNGAHDYCMKEETRVEGPYEFGKRPVQRNNKQDWEAVFKAAQENRMDDIPAAIKVQHYGNLKKIAKDSMRVEKRTEGRECIWLWGSTGIGKSRSQWHAYPDAYPKMCNKWWDGYQQQKTVILDDISNKHDVLGDHIKRWADPYTPYIAEDKGGAQPPNPDRFIVTSNFHPSEIWDDDRVLQPILRRFSVIHLVENPQYFGPGNVDWIEQPYIPQVDVRMSREDFMK